MRRKLDFKAEMVRRGLVQADVAQAAQMSESRLSRIINGRATPQDFERHNLSQALGITRDQLRELGL
jgi:transcriptional regulator with XRE-family HTH domain